MDITVIILDIIFTTFLREVAHDTHGKRICQESNPLANIGAQAEWPHGKAHDYQLLNRGSNPCQSRKFSGRIRFDFFVL